MVPSTLPSTQERKARCRPTTGLLALLLRLLTLLLSSLQGSGPVWTSCPPRPPSRASYPPLDLPAPCRNISLTSFLESQARPIGQGPPPPGPCSPGQEQPSGALGSWVQKVLCLYRTPTCKYMETCPHSPFGQKPPGTPPPMRPWGAKATQNHTRAEAPPWLLPSLD